MSDYKKYQHVEKLGNLEVEDILFGDCYIFPKIDGTNAQIWRAEDGRLLCGSRNRQLSIDKDNAGFMAHICKNVDMFSLILDHFPKGAQIFGEWLVPHSLKTYSDDSWRKFYIFDVKLEDRYMSFPEYEKIFKEIGYEDYIPPMRVLVNPREEDCHKVLEENNYLIKDGEGAGEGIVIKNYNFTNRHGRTNWAKIVTSDFKTKHRREMGAPVTTCTAHIEERIVNELLTQDIIDKVHANIISENDGWNCKFIPQLIGRVFYDFVRECTWDYVKKFKNPKIDFKMLQKYVVLKIKETKPELF